MNIKNIAGRVSRVAIPITFDFNFLYDLLLAYGRSQASITRLKKGTYNLAEDRTHEVYWKNVVLFRYVDHHELHVTIDDLKRSYYGQKYSPRFIIVTDLDQLLTVDTKTEDTLEIALKDISRHYAFFLPWAGMEKSQIITENEADIKAAERMAKLYDEIIAIEENLTDDPTFYHNLNVFFSRLLFCFFAEDTEVFQQSQFTRAISGYTQTDGSDLNAFLDEIFEAMDEEDRNRYPAHIAAFPYVNGGLFRLHIPTPKFNAKARRLILECGELNWSEINPDIFGSMIQAVVHPGQRAGLGMHYTSVVNIMKVIEPLFLEELKEELDKAEGDEQKLGRLLRRVYSIKVFDPACGSGNFLIIAFKELRKIEHAILGQILRLKGNSGIKLASGLRLENFYGIEIDDFAREVAVLSLWLAKHQMNIEFKKQFGKNIPLIPLKDTGNVLHGNAATTSWTDIYSPTMDDEIYIIGNPPYAGSSMQEEDQKHELAEVAGGFDNYKNLDYIAIWFIKAAQYIRKSNAKVGLVSTNSISQGEQVALLWKHIIDEKINIEFAYTSFKWTNHAKHNAGVTCVIIGLARRNNKLKRLYIGQLLQHVQNINAYLLSGPDIYIPRRGKPLSNIPDMVYGNKPTDNGELILNENEREKLLEESPEAALYIKRYMGSEDLMKGVRRYCLWIDDKELGEAKKIPEINRRLEAVADFRRKSKAPSTKDYARFPNRFKQRTYLPTQSIIIPSVTSEKRDYVPIDYLDSNTVISNAAFAMYHARPWAFGLVSSKLHTVWVKTVAGRLKTDVRYSSELAYNNFPVPSLTDEQKKIITNNVFAVLEARERHPEKTFRQLYDPETMPSDLKQAHADLDEVIERCYRVRPFDNDEDRLSHLFKLYEIMAGVQKGLLNA